VLQPKVPTTSVPDPQHSPAQTQTATLEPLQQLIQQMGGLQQQQQLPASLLHSQPLPVPNAAVSKSDDEANPIQMFIRQLGSKGSKPQVCLQPTNQILDWSAGFHFRAGREMFQGHCMQHSSAVQIHAHQVHSVYTTGQFAFQLTLLPQEDGKGCLWAVVP
jgi:hypothetical protein